MAFANSRRPRGAVRHLAALAAVTAAALTGTGIASAQSANAHAYRRGTVPPRGQLQAGLATAPTGQQLSYQGGVSGVGVTTGPPKVYLVFWGSQWGTQGTTTLNGKTYANFTGDPQGIAPVLQAFFAGLGTGGETWSGVATQYCQGIAVGATTCPAGSARVGYPTGGALAGVWEDTSTTVTAAPTAANIAQEAEAAAGHFGNTTTTANRNAQYFIVSPHGVDPDGFTVNGAAQYCAWHDYTGDSGLGSVTQPNGTLAFTNMPYLTDVGASCGSDFVNSGTAGALDGVTMVAGHEYTETITDQFPAGGWYNNSYGEIGDMCAWASPNATTGSTDLALTTGTFAVQPMWANDANSGSGGCLDSHAVLSASTITVTSPGAQSATVGTAITPLGVSASDSASGQTLSYAASGLPAGLSINTATGVISGTPTAAVWKAPITVTVTDTSGASGSASFTWTTANAAGNTVTVTQPANQSTVLSKSASLQIAATDTQSGQVYTYAATGLPTGLAINASTGLISGTPSVATSGAAVTVTATDATGVSGTATFIWTVTAPNVITVTNPGTQTSPLSTTIGAVQIAASDSAAGQTLTYSATGLPTGLAINSATGAITGKTGSTAKTSSVVVTVKDTTGVSSSVSFSWAVKNTVTVTNPGTRSSVHGTSVSLQIAASDTQTGASLSYSATNLPSGLTINATTGLISGTPKTTGTKSVTVTVKDASGASGTATFSWSIT